jgi:hypothetical protein
MQNPEKKITISGRLSFPVFTAQEAYERSQKGSYPAKDVASAKPDFLMLVNDTQWKKFLKHATEVYLPFCAEQHKKGEKSDALEPKEVKLLIDGISGDLADQVYNSPAKPVHEKSLALAPDSVATIKAIGTAGTDIIQKAIVNNESELKIADPDILDWPVVRPISQTNFELYPGALVKATLNLYSYRNGKLPGFSAGVTTCVYWAEADRFGGGVDVDLDEIFLD